jgi:hypothetical protein
LTTAFFAATFPFDCFVDTFGGDPPTPAMLNVCAFLAVPLAAAFFAGFGGTDAFGADVVGLDPNKDSVGVFCCGFCAGAFSEEETVDPNNGRVRDFFGVDGGDCGGVLVTEPFEALGGDPKIENVGDFCAGVEGGGKLALLVGFAAKMFNVGERFGGSDVVCTATCFGVALFSSVKALCSAALNFASAASFLASAAAFRSSSILFVLLAGSIFFSTDFDVD